MEWLFRKIKMTRWLPSEKELSLQAGMLLNPDDIPADPIGDFCTTKNSLSFYGINTIDKKDNSSNLWKVIAALAATQDYPNKVEYSVIKKKTILDMGFEIEYAPGDTPDAEVNSWHFNMTRLSGMKILSLSRIFIKEGVKDVFTKDRVEKDLARIVTLETFDKAKVKIKSDTLRNDLGLPLQSQDK